MTLVDLLRILLVAGYTILIGLLASLVFLIPSGSRAFVPFARLWSRLVLRTCRVRVQATGTRPGHAAIYMANHQSQFDIPALVTVVPGPFRFVAKRELIYVPFFGWALWLAGLVFLPRADREESIRRLGSAAALLGKGTSVILFPEGTRSPDGRLLPFKKGGFVLAVRTGTPIVPVAIRGSGAILPKGSLAVRPGTIDITFMPEVDTSGYRYETRDDLIERVRRSILETITTPGPA
jgi:1-acyl-sn-glycerol-3-phosphate acyltransferase